MPSVPGRPIVDGAGDPTPLTPQPDLQAGPRGSDLLEAVFQEAPLGMLLFDVSGRIIRANMAFADMLGSTPRLLQGRSLMDVLHPSDRERGREAISRVERDDRTWVSLQQRCLRDDGESRWGDLTIGTLGAEAGGVRHGLALLREVDERGVSTGAGAGAADFAREPLASPPRERPVTEAHAPMARARILVVDDEPLMGSAITRVLAEHEVVALTSARVAMTRIAAGERFDVILCDVMMPDFSGIDLHAAITRQAPELQDRLVFVTGGAYTTEAIELLERVPNPRLEKPILPRALHEAVAAILAGARCETLAGGEAR